MIKAMENPSCEDDSYDPFLPMEYENEFFLDTGASQIHSPSHSINMRDRTHHRIFTAFCTILKTREGMLELDQEDYNDVPYTLEEVAWVLSNAISSLRSTTDALSDEDIDLMAKRLRYMLRSATRSHPYWKF